MCNAQKEDTVLDMPVVGDAPLHHGTVYAHAVLIISRNRIRETVYREQRTGLRANHNHSMFQAKTLLSPQQPQ